MSEIKKQADILINFINDAVIETQLDPEQEKLILEYIDGVFKDGYQRCLNDLVVKTSLAATSERKNRKC
jgi:hypothetical protein